MPVMAADGGAAVLKIQFPDRESEHEASALAAWDGAGAVRLVAHDPQRRALLIERCVPGTPLSARGSTEALTVLIDLVRRLAIAAPSKVGMLGAEAARWRTNLLSSWEAAGRPFEERLIAAAIEVFDDARFRPGDAVLLHQDLHGNNVLRAEREPWLVIDPKPLAGDPAFQAAPIVRSAELGTAQADVRYRLDRLSDELGFDQERARRWTLAQTLAWSFENGRVLDWHLQVARWLV
jgi:streptomycin 6-kinase